METCDCILCFCCCGYYSLYATIFCCLDHVDKKMDPIYTRVNSHEEEEFEAY